MFQVQCLKSTTNKATEFYSKYSIGPFLKGQSTTIGNSLRRVLLSNLQGLAIIGVRITGIDHEFSTISNVKEDVVDILLNLKQIVLKGDTTEPTLARLNIKEAGVVVASDIELPNNISLVDSSQYIASL
jgi:DNA-directed RNA polymerase subunit alpha